MKNCALVKVWNYDLLALTQMLKKEFKAKEIHVYGLLETGFAAICANAQTESIDHVAAVNSPWSLLFDARTVNFNAVSPFAKFLPGAIYSLALSIPGFLQWGDVSLAAALGHGTVDFVSPANLGRHTAFQSRNPEHEKGNRTGQGKVCLKHRTAKFFYTKSMTTISGGQKYRRGIKVVPIPALTRRRVPVNRFS